MHTRPTKGELKAARRLARQWREQAASRETPPDRARVLTDCARELEERVAESAPPDARVPPT